MTSEEILSFCEFKNCRLSVGSADIGFIHFDGSGLRQGSHTYVRFNMLHEVAHTASVEEVLERAQTFCVSRGDESRTLSREEFQTELQRFQDLTAD